MIRISIGIVAIIVIAAIMLHMRPHHSPNLLKNPTDLQYWHWEQISDQVSGGVKLDQDAIRVDITSVSAIDWQLQLYHKSVILQDGHQYRVSFTGRADKERSIGIKTTRASWFPSYGTTGLSDEFTLTKDWKTYSNVFTAKKPDVVPGRAPLFIVGQTTGTIWLKNISIEENY